MITSCVPRRRGIACQEPRATAALVVEWLRILHREGWLGSARRNAGEIIRDLAGRNLRNFMNRRRRLGLHLPYGSAADGHVIAGCSSACLLRPRWPGRLSSPRVL